jgi:Na+-driven multidrug efflux pump/anti-sigma regulatory factor (Ser/Thr protein kinase)
MLGNLVDGVIVSNMISTEAMSAVNLSRPIIQLYYTFYLLFGLGGSLLVAYSMGKDDKQQANRTFSMVICLLLLFAAVVTLCGLMFPQQVTSLICTNDIVFEYAYDYFKPVLWGCVFYMGSFFFGTYTTIDGAPRLVSIAMIVDNICNLLFDLIFIKVIYLGVTGSSLASLIGHAVGIGVMASHYFAGKSTFRLVKFGLKSLCKSAIAIAKSGAPFAIASVCLTVYMYTANIIMQNYFGEVGIYIFSVMLSLLTFYNFFLSGACNTLQSLGALLVGLGDKVGLRLSVNAAFKFMLTSLVICCGILWAMPAVVCRMFGCPDYLLAECCYATRIYALAFVFFCGIYLLMVNYKLLGEQALSTFLSFALSLTVIPVMFGIAVFAPRAIWWSNLLAYVIVFVVLLIWSEIKRKKGMSVITLLPTIEEQPTLDFSVDYTNDGLASALGKIHGFMVDNGIEGQRLMAADLAAEELLKNIIQHNEQKRQSAGRFRAHPYIDVRLTISADEAKALTISLHDDGKPFNPSAVTARQGSYGLTLATGFGQQLSYKYLFGQNMTLVKV